MTTPVEVRTIEHGDPSPLPENNWLWRRTYVFAVTALLCAHVWWTSGKTDDVYTLRMTIRNDQGILVLFALLYLAGATTERITELFAALRSTRKETRTFAPPPASVTTTPEGTTVDTPADDGRLPAGERVNP